MRQSHRATTHRTMICTRRPRSLQQKVKLFIFLILFIIVLLAAFPLWRSHRNAYTALQDSINAVQLSTLDTGAKKGLKPVTLMILLHFI